MNEEVASVDATDTRGQLLYVGSDAAVIKAALAGTYEIVTATTQSVAQQHLSESDYLLLGDLPARDQVALLEFAVTEYPTVPVLLFVSEINPEVIQTAVRTGCQDIIYRDTLLSEPAQSEQTRLHDRLVAQTVKTETNVADTVLEASRILMSAAHDEVDTKIEWGLRSIGHQLGADRCAIYEYADDHFRQTHEWHPADAPLTDTTERFKATQFPGYQTHLSQFELYAVPTANDEQTDDELPTEVFKTSNRTSSEDQPTEYLETRETQALLAIPIVIDWELDAVLLIEDTSPRSWSRDIRRRLRTFGELIGQTLRRDREHQALQRQNERLERFASVISHDLQNPLNVITGYTDLIKTTGNPEHIEEIQAAAERMEAMLKELLALARGGDDLGEIEDVDLVEIVNNAWGAVETHDATLCLDNLGTVKADPTRLQQVFENLFRNAIEHAGETVTVWVEATEQGFAIEDNGPGIAQSKHGQIFEKGYTDSSGTGLGLSIVKAVVEAHGWEIAVTEGKQGGARFEVTVPDGDPTAMARLD